MRRYVMKLKFALAGVLATLSVMALADGSVKSYWDARQSEWPWPSDYDKDLAVWQQTHQSVSSSAMPGLALDFIAACPGAETPDEFDFIVTTTMSSEAVLIKFFPLYGAYLFIR